MLDDWPKTARWLVYNGLIFLVLVFRHILCDGVLLLPVLEAL